MTHKINVSGLGDERARTAAPANSKIYRPEIVQWVLVAVAFGAAIIWGLSLSESLDQSGLVVMVLTCLAFVIVHGLQRYTWQQMAVFFVVTAVWSYFWENLSIATGFPFGFYHYDNSLGPKLIEAPLFLALGYFQLAYLSWNMTHVLLDRYSNEMKGAWTWVMPLVATVIMVMLDNVFDPYNSTVTAHYVWHDGGAYFGVPFVNFLGWYLCCWTVYQSFALYLRFYQPDKPSTPAVLFKPAYWAANTAVFGFWGLIFVMKGFTVDPGVQLTSLDHQVWNLASLLQTAGLIAIATIGFVCLVAMIKIFALGTIPKPPVEMKNL